MSDAARRTILILEPERDTGELFVRALETRKDCKCYLTSTEEEALELLNDIPFDILLADLATLLSTQFGLVRRVKRLFPGTTIIIDAYLHQKPYVAAAVDLGASGYFFKPVKVDVFRKKMEQFYSVTD